MKNAVTDALQGTWFAADMPTEVRQRLAEMAVVADHPQGVVLVRAGEPADALGVIVTGRIAIRPSVPGSEPRTILTLEDGDLFGWSTVLPGSKATSSAVTLAPTRVVLLPRDRLARALEADPVLAAVIYERVLRAVARRLQSTRMQLLDLYRAGDEPW
jgi:CRP/FNR family cyclic AMP-dependent transcriptional regulator